MFVSKLKQTKGCYIFYPEPKIPRGYSSCRSLPGHRDSSAMSLSHVHIPMAMGQEQGTADKVNLASSLSMSGTFPNGKEPVHGLLVCDSCTDNKVCACGCRSGRYLLWGGLNFHFLALVGFCVACCLCSNPGSFPTKHFCIHSIGVFSA